MKNKKWGHDELARDLAEHLARPERMIWVDMQLGPSGSPRPDVYSMRKSYTEPKPLAYEIKISTADYRSDITKGKWQSYLQYAAGVTFCVPAGLITKADLPKGCGLMVRGEEGWRTLKAPTLNAVKLPEKLCLKLLIDGMKYLQHNGWRVESWNTYLANKRLRKELGDEVADFIQDVQSAKHQLEYKLSGAEARAKAIIENAEKATERARENAKKIEENAAMAVKSLADQLGLRDGAMAARWAVENACRDFIATQSADHRIAEVNIFLQRAAKEVERAKEQIEKLSKKEPAGE